MWMWIAHLAFYTNRLAEAGHAAVGVEISEKAVKDFFTESHQSFEQEQVGKLVQYKVILFNGCITST